VLQVKNEPDVVGARHALRRMWMKASMRPGFGSPLILNPVPWWVGGGFGGAFYGIARIMVVIPAKDRRLKQCKAHLKKHARLLYETYQKESNEKGLKWEDWYFYFGNIKPSRFREIVEYLAEESP
jgi:hypothetical protein